MALREAWQAEATYSLMAALQATMESPVRHGMRGID
jgi:hypothetical protein